jgi:hypothetical protein
MQTPDYAKELPSHKTIITRQITHVKHPSKEKYKISKQYFCNARLIEMLFVFVFVDRIKLHAILFADERDSKQPTGDDDE